MTTYESAQEMQEQLSSCEELSSRKRSMTLDLDNAGRSEHSSEEGCSSCLLTTPDLDKLQLTSPELEEFIMVTGDYVKDKTQMVPAVDDTPPVWYISSDEDSSCGDSAPPTTMPEVPRKQSRHEEFSLRKRTVALDYDNGRPYQHYSKQARMLQKVPRPADEHPLSSINMLDREKTKIEEKRRRNRIAQKKCRQRQIDYNLQLQVRVRELKTEIAWMKSTASPLLHRLHWLRQEVSRHVTQGCQI
ncbi:hypothetical protein HPB52_003684 [Rhipicephalus sanguineus]|uniref:BZIP domain-containing protein n=1 Tax=Rhipicephalus sanguineus TaxID=34632 RepID=A0A9D4PC98_RHISA|nr:hypothetical protein HPB52_003684 [Rhipicephalus sanguineus]